jgi:hypothetical protein
MTVLLSRSNATLEEKERLGYYTGKLTNEVFSRQVFKRYGQ